MSLYKELTDQPLNVLIDYWFGEPLDGPEHADTFYEEVAYEISRRGVEGAKFLVEQLTLDGQDRTHCLMGGLSMAELPIEVRKDLIRPFLASDSADELAQAIHSFCYFLDKEVRGLIEPNVAHEDVRVRVFALMYLGKVFPLTSLDLLVQSLDDPVWNIRATAIDEIDELEDKQLSASFLGRIAPFLDDPHHYVRAAAAWFMYHHVWWNEEIEDISKAIEEQQDKYFAASLVHLAWDLRDPESWDVGGADVVIDRLDNSEPTIRLAAVDVLAEWGPVSRAIERFPAFLERCEQDPDPRVRDLVPLLNEHLRFEQEWQHDG